MKITASYKILRVQLHTLEASDLTKVGWTIANIIGFTVLNRCVTQVTGHIAV
jgi:hypothetical protein